jgi:aminopeptidase
VHAEKIVNYCTSVKRGDNVLVQTEGQDGFELAAEICKEVARQGGHPVIVASPLETMRTCIDLTPIEDLATTPRNIFELIKASDVFIIIFSPANTKVLENADPKRLAMYNKAFRPIKDEGLKKRWNVTLHPTNALAQDAGMSLTEYRDFVYSAIICDWNTEIDRMKKLKGIMERASQVQLIGKDTDLSFSIEGRTVLIDDAKANMPGGEVFTAPVDDSATGEIYYDLPAIYCGKEVTDIRLTFDKGVIVDYSASKNESFLTEMIEFDEGSKRLGEFGIGTNRSINRFTRNMLFDEKMTATVHLAIGFAYEDCGGINKSSIHWDMIKTMRPGEIMMDDTSLQKNGEFSWE